LYANDNNLLYENINIIEKKRENLLRACKGADIEGEAEKNVLLCLVTGMQETEYNDSRLNLRRYVKVQICPNDSKGFKSHSR